nr:MORN repeat containing protein [Marseillevirus futianmevirus]
MEKFLQAREAVSFVCSSGDEKIGKTKFLKRRDLGLGDYEHVLPDGTLHGVAISRLRLEITRVVYDHGEEISRKVFAPSTDFSFAYPKIEWLGKTRVERDQSGTTTSFTSKKIDVSRGVLNRKQLKKGSIKEIICRNFLASFDL